MQHHQEAGVPMMHNQRTMQRSMQMSVGSQQALGNAHHQISGSFGREDDEKSLVSSMWSHSVTVEATRQDLIFAYYNLNRQRRIWSRRCSFLLVLATLLAVGCGVLRLISFIYKRSPQAVESEVVVMNDFSLLGCFPLLGNDAPSKAAEFMVRDNACMNPEKNGLLGQLRCRSGLPFYRFSTGRVIPWRWCAKLCLLKGFDISGVVDAKECRCGASEQNLQVWAKDVMPREDLHFDPTAAVPPDASSCRIVAVEYLGPLPVEAWRSDVTEADLSYIRSIVSSSVVSTLERQRAAKVPIQGVIRPTALPAGVAVNWTKEAEKSSCNPGPCASGWPWPIWTVHRSGVPFAYDDTVLPSTKASVQQAMRRLQQMTCVKFTEVSLSFGLTWKIVLTERYPGPCFASVIGYPGVSFNDSEINLKTCAQNAGVIMHELGHALGMSHEQARQDRDEYIRINWMHVPQDYLEQYHSSPTSYIGSRDMGFVPYDYRSVMHYSADAAMQSLPVVNGQGVHDGAMGQRNDFSPLDVLQLRDMYRCDALDVACVDQDEAVGNLFGTPAGRKANCKLLKDTGYCQHQSYGETISYFCPKMCDRCPEFGVEGHTEHIEKAPCADVDETVCQFLEDYCPGKVSGLEQYMSMNCQKRCCLQSCNNTCQYVSEEEEEAVAGPVVKGPSVAMEITFDCPRYESERLLQQRLQLRFSRLLGSGVTVTLLKAPSCLQGCQHGEARVEQLCCQECVQKCTELRKKWVLLTSKELSTFSGAFRVAVRGKTVDVPFTWEDLVAYSTQNRALTYVAAVLSALGILCVALSIAFFIWWRRISSTPADEEIETEVLLIDDEAPKDPELGDAQSEHTEHTHISQRELGNWLHQQEANTDFLPHSWCWRHKIVLVACVCLAALASSGFMIYVDLAEPASSGLLEDSAPPAPSNSAPVFKYMGCFTADMPLAAAGPVEFYDTSCMRTGNSCGGLPFYRLKTSDGRSCAEFCLSKGLDLSGILDGAECRCGASANHAIWEATLARPDLQWRATKVPSSSPSCRIDAMRLSGPSTDIFEALRSNDLQEEDLRYISGIVRGLLIEPPKPVPGPPVGSMTEKVIPFSFVEPVAQETKDAFREALDEVARSTCISFYETNGTESKLRVYGIGHLCEASQVGWSQGVDLHMGWCCTSFHLGAILHELGHALGLINEEQRSDRSTFVEEPSSPISGVGPMFYDFSSVMHGPATSLPVRNNAGVHDPQLGQRRGLSALDVLKLQEIYGCGAPPHDIKVGIWQQLMRHCKSGPLEPWMSENCGETCEPPVQRWLGFSFAFSTPGGFDLNKPKDQKMLGDGFAVGISEVLGVSNTTVQVSPGEAKVEVACGCQGIRGRSCRSCSTLEALLLRSSQQTLQRWLRQCGFAQLEVLSYRVNGEGLIWLLQDSRVQISLCFVGTLSATLAIVQAGWYLWWTQKVHVDAEVSEGE